MMEPASPQGSRAKEGGGIKGGPGPRSRRLFGSFLVAQKGTQPVESVERKNRLSFITVNSDRLKNYQVTVNGTSILQQQYTYDNNNNITAIVEGSAIKTFEYDVNNQLTRSVTPGKFLENDTTPGTYGIKIGDYLGTKMMDFTPVLTAMMGLDYNSSSIGIDFGTTASGVKKIQIIPDGKFTVHRVTQRTLDLYTSADNSTYTIIPRTSWTFATDSKGVITITLKERVATRYLKVHVKFDERDSYFNPKSKATFLNDFAKMLRIYQEATTRTEEFQYDADGNRKFQRVTLIQSKEYDSSYYANSDRLKTDGKYAFVYDEAGNLVTKGNHFNINGDTVNFTATTGEGVEYWQYRYNLLNRLTEVKKNGAVVADYEYSPDGLRQVKRGSKGTIHYVFEGTEPIFEKRIADGRIRSYVYALGSHLARVDGAIGDSSAKVYFYHTDQVGSIKAITDQGGKVVFNADYFAFGTKYTSNGDFDETHGFTGKEYDSDTGLYYFNGRWYDPDLGRFISEDPVMDPNNPNLYSYCANNPLSNIDPTGYDLASTISSICSAISSAVSSIGHAISSAASSVGHAISSAASSVSRAISSVVSSVASAINNAVSSACNALSNAWNNITGNGGPSDDTSEAINRFLKSQPKHPIQDPEEKIKEMMGNDPFHKDGSSDDHGGSGHSSEIAKKFGPQLPDFKGYSDGSGTSLKVIAESLTPMAESFGPYGVMALDILDLGIMAYDLFNGVCFSEDTPIYIKAGHKLIKDIKVGDHVYSENPETGEKGLKKVTRKFIKETKALVHIYVGNIEIKATPTHPFWVIGKGWVEAGKLDTGDKLLLYSGKKAKVTGKKFEELLKPIKVYNFEVEDWHTYFVSKYLVLVHNRCMAGYRAGDFTSRGRMLTGHAALRCNQRGFNETIIDNIIDNNKKGRYKEIDENGDLTWVYTDKRGNTVVTNEDGTEIVTVYSPAENGKYIPKK